MVYNKEQKMSFVKTISEAGDKDYSVPDVIYIFQQVGELEEEYRKDVSLWRKDEAIKFFSTKSTWYNRGKRDWRKAITIFSDYYDWCGKKENYFKDALEKASMNPFIKEIKDMHSGKQDLKLLSPGELKNLNGLLNPREFYIAYGYWLGISDEELLLARIEDLNENVMRLYKRCSNERELEREIKIPDDFVIACENSNEFTVLNAENPLTRTSIKGEEIYKRRSDKNTCELSDTQFKTLVSTVRKNINTIFKNAGLLYNLSWIRTSGCIYKLKLLAAELALSFKETLETEEGKKIAGSYGINDYHARFNFYNYYKKYLE